ncbi:MAG: DUF5995 family protein [Chitinophagales bacterium]
MNHKLLIYLSILLLCTFCTKEKQPSLAEQHLQIVGEGTTFYSDEDYNLLVELTDTSKIYSIAELKYSMNTLTAILNKYHDRAGAFPTLYNVVTNVAYQSLSTSPSAHAAEGRAFMNEFAKHFIRNLHSYLLGETVEPAWNNYFVRVADGKNTILHLVLSGINAHITYDIPFVLNDIKAQPAFKDDFVEYTDFIAGTYPDAAAELTRQFGVQNADEFFHFYALGTVLDSLNNPGFTTHLAIDVLRTESWNRGMNLVQQRLSYKQTHGICWQSFSDREKLIQFFDDQKLLN